MPAKLGSRDDLGLALTFLRWLKEWQQEDLAAASGVSLDGIQAIEQGKRRHPTLKTLGPIAAALGVELSTVEAMVALIHRFRGGSAGGTASDAVAAAEVDRPALRSPGVAFARAVNGLLQEALGPEPQATTAAGRQEARSRASALWELVKGCPGDTLRRLVCEVGTFQTVEFCELLCERSRDAAGDSAAEAIRLAELAVEVARQVPGPEDLRSRLAGYAGVHLANGRRVAGDDLPAAGEAFARALALWHAGASEEPVLLNAARVLSLEASLRRAQRRLPEALALLDQALAIDRWGETPALLLVKARTLAELGEFEASMFLLEQVASHVDADREPRQRYVVCNLLLLDLCHLGRHAAAEMLLPELKALALRLGNRLDLLRVDWLAGKIAAGRGRADEAVAILARVRQQCLATNNLYDVALVTLELAEVHAALGRTAEVKALARESAPLFADQGVHREARRALALFCRAAEEERLTTELLRSLIAFLYRSRHDARARFRQAG